MKPSNKMVKKNEYEQYVSEARSFDQNRMLAARRTSKICLGVAAISICLALASTFAVMALTPLKTVEPFVVRVDNSTGIVEVVNALKTAPATYDESITRHFAAQYVRSRENFKSSEAQNNFNVVSLLSRPQEQARYAAWIGANNPQSPQLLYRNAVATTHIKSTSFVNSSVVQVRFFKKVRDNANNTETVTHWVSTMTFDYVNGEMSTQDRLINPLGFLVSDYRDDPEVVQ